MSPYKQCKNAAWRVKETVRMLEIMSITLKQDSWLDVYETSLNTALQYIA